VDDGGKDEHTEDKANDEEDDPVRPLHLRWWSATLEEVARSGGAWRRFRAFSFCIHIL